MTETSCQGTWNIHKFSFKCRNWSIWRVTAMWYQISTILLSLLQNVYESTMHVRHIPNPNVRKCCFACASFALYFIVVRFIRMNIIYPQRYSVGLVFTKLPCTIVSICLLNFKTINDNLSRRWKEQNGGEERERRLNSAGPLFSLCICMLNLTYEFDDDDGDNHRWWSCNGIINTQHSVLKTENQQWCYIWILVWIIIIINNPYGCICDMKI